ncbi:hypothetical protein [Streptomyces sp. NPDC014685]|uniref:hypothetical protein n=1 Tax=Streptomyces sp. NPDC014685 TaxID=3364881 RepID=UPI0037011C90
MPLVVIGDPGVLARADEVVGTRLALRPIPSVDRAEHTPGTVDVIAGSDLPDDLPRGTLDARAGAAAFQYVRQGIRLPERRRTGAGDRTDQQRRPCAWPESPTPGTPSCWPICPAPPTTR